MLQQIMMKKMAQTIIKKKGADIIRMLSHAVSLLVATKNTPEQPADETTGLLVLVGQDGHATYLFVTIKNGNQVTGVKEAYTADEIIDKIDFDNFDLDKLAQQVPDHLVNESDINMVDDLLNGMGNEAVNENPENTAGDE